MRIILGTPAYISPDAHARMEVWEGILMLDSLGMEAAYPMDGTRIKYVVNFAWGVG